MIIIDTLLRLLRKVIQFFLRKKFHNPECIYDRQIANNQIYQLLNKNEPCMISRFGTVEINCINNYLCIENNKKNKITGIISFLTEKTHTPWWNKSHFFFMKNNAGVFPIDEKIFESFCKRYLEDIPLIDIIGSHQYYEKFMPLKKDIIKIQLETLYPFFVEMPWTRILENKKVLVIHPFEDSIKTQYSNKENIFSDYNILPNFKLITLKAPITTTEEIEEYSSWLEVLEYMEKKIKEIDFDICLIGCGAYGLPLAAFVKRIGKQAVHIGGGLQLMFGILGNRWTSQYNNIWEYRPGIKINTNYKILFNNNWIFPNEFERPKNSSNIENACYWK